MERVVRGIGKKISPCYEKTGADYRNNLYEDILSAV